MFSMKGRIFRISWNKNSAEEIASAEKKFKELIRQGWFAFTVKAGNKKVQIFDFNPEHEEIFLIPLTEGG